MYFSIHAMMYSSPALIFPDLTCCKKATLEESQTRNQMQQSKRLPKFKRVPEAHGRKQITERSIQNIETISRYRFLPTSFLVRLIPGFTTTEHSRMLFDRGLINRFAFPRLGNPGEFIYYLDNPEALNLLRLAGHTIAADTENEVRSNREKAYFEINDPSKSSETQGRLLFLAHELMISRFHYMLQLSARRSFGEVELATFKQGAQLWNRIEFPTREYNGFTKRWEKGDPESFPHPSGFILHPALFEALRSPAARQPFLRSRPQDRL